MVNHKCPVCEKTDDVFSLCEVNGFSVYQCRNCGADHVFPMPDKNTLKNYYDRKDWFEGGEAGGYRNYDEQTTGSLDMLKPILDQFDEQKNLSILDIGCGYGTHLALAAEKGWKCFGVEVSDHARQIAQQRLDGSAYIVESVEDMIPHEFDLVLMLDVIEHLPSPYPLLYSLFSIGAITQKTKLVITTPNAGSDEARKTPAEWVYRHPPSHLVYYSEQSLRFFLEKLHFCDVVVQGIHTLESGHLNNAALGNYGGLLVTTMGSDFTEFMRERFVPGTWSKLAEYEHIPRYALAKTLVTGKHVLDFGCGTGYGSAMLAEAAASVTGLDIDEKAIAWAIEKHHSPQLRFHLCSDLGDTLPSASFDAVTCFEMIEHVDYETQQCVIASIAKLLRNNGMLIISTPNPEITKLYGANPYHLREMTLPEFHELLAVHFPHIRILKQRVRNSIAFDEVATSQEICAQSILHRESGVLPLAFIAFCSKQPIEHINSIVVFDEEVDLIQDTISKERKLNLVRFDAYRLMELKAELEIKLRKLEEDLAVSHQAREIRRLNVVVKAKEALVNHHAQEIARLNALVTHHAQEIARLNEVVVAKDIEIGRYEEAILRVNQSKWHRLGNALKARPITPHNFSRIVYLSAGLIIPKSFRQKVAPIVSKLRQQHLNARQDSLEKMDEHASVEKMDEPVLPEKMVENDAYLVKPPATVATVRQRVVHVIANFMTGGSSRLVVDLIENLGGQYNQSVITSFIPDPPAYIGLEIEECRLPLDETPFIEYFQRTQPDFVHVHYWGDFDEPWYAKAIEAARQLGLPVIENVNTPVAPYLSDAVFRYVYVSDYVRYVYGQNEAHHITIYPGSDFSHFDGNACEKTSNDCVGMVYRLENDKLNEQSIDPFIRIAQRRPQTRILIVGGGSLLAPFQKAVELAGVNNCFEFTGYVSYDALPGLYRRMSVFIAPTWNESFGQVSSFAMNMRVPVIGYDIGGIHEIVGNPELLAPLADADRLADIAINLLDSPELLERIGHQQAARAQALFSIQAMIKAYAELYAEIGHTQKSASS